MPAYIEGGQWNLNVTAPRPHWDERPVHIGLINNMADAALEATERQFLRLLDSAADDRLVRLSLFALPDVPRNDFGRRHISRWYSSVEDLWNSELDGLIVTGREPRTSDLTDEPYWRSLTQVLEWAKHNTHSTIWSCLAAHAAILHLDGVVRRKSSEKRFGVLDCTVVSDHQLMAGVPPCLKVPHSRWNDIPEQDLLDSGYRILTRAKDVGADTFVKPGKSLFVFFQGHPEYESDSLLLEYRRDIGRYLNGEMSRYPLLPQAYFDDRIAETLDAIRVQAMSGRSENILADVTTALRNNPILNNWHLTAKCVYSNWLGCIYRQKKRHVEKAKMGTVGSLAGSSTTLVL